MLDAPQATAYARSMPIRCRGRLSLLWAALGVAGCSFVIELDGPSFIDIPERLDEGLTPVDSFVPDMAPDASVTVPDLGSDARPPPPAPPPFDLTLSDAAPVLVHNNLGQLRAERLIALRHRFPLAAGEWVTVPSLDPPGFVSLLGAAGGETARLDLPTTSGRSSSMRARLESPFPEAVSYALTNGCRQLRCSGEACAGWFDAAQMSLSVTDRCTVDGEVRTIAFALDADERALGWALARDPFPESSNSVPSFSEWVDDLVEVTVHVSGAEPSGLYAAPWLGIAYDAALPARETDDGQTVITVPGGLSDVVEFGLDLNPPELGSALGRARQGVRHWRRPESNLPVVFDASRLPPVPEVAVFADETGHRPRVAWRFADDVSLESGLLARVEFVWETEAIGRLEWVIFTDASRGQVRLPHLTDAFADARPTPGTQGVSAQVTLVDCLGRESRADHFANPCPIWGPARVAEPLHEEVRWSAGYVRPEGAAPDDEAGVPDGG